MVDLIVLGKSAPCVNSVFQIIPYLKSISCGDEIFAHLSYNIWSIQWDGVHLLHPKTLTFSAGISKIPYALCNITEANILLLLLPR